MKHQEEQMNYFLKAIILGAALLGLAACDSGSGGNGGEAQSDAAKAPEAAPQADASPMTAAAEIPVTVHRDENGVPTGEITVGNADADLEIIEYLSVTCSHCARHHSTTWQDIKDSYVSAGQAKVTFRMFARSPLDELISMLPLCVADDQVYPMLDIIMSRQSQWLRGNNGQEVLSNVAGLARRAGMSRASFDSCVRTQPLLDNIREVTRIGIEEDGVTATPTFFIGSEMLSGALPFEDFKKVIDSNL